MKGRQNRNCGFGHGEGSVLLKRREKQRLTQPSSLSKAQSEISGSSGKCSFEASNYCTVAQSDLVRSRFKIADIWQV